MIDSSNGYGPNDNWNNGNWNNGSWNNGNWGDEGPVAGIEAMIQDAGRYVRVSDDLRPRVLESARTQRVERRAQRHIQRAAVFFVLLAMITPSIGHSPRTAASDGRAASPYVGAENVLSAAESKAACGGDFGWGMVEAFTELRRRQAKALGAP